MVEISHCGSWGLCISRRKRSSIPDDGERRWTWKRDETTLMNRVLSVCSYVTFRYLETITYVDQCIKGIFVMFAGNESLGHNRHLEFVRLTFWHNNMKLSGPWKRPRFFTNQSKVEKILMLSGGNAKWRQHLCLLFHFVGWLKWISQW